MSLNYTRTIIGTAGQGQAGYVVRYTDHCAMAFSGCMTSQCCSSCCCGYGSSSMGYNSDFVSEFHIDVDCQGNLYHLLPTCTGGGYRAIAKYTPSGNVDWVTSFYPTCWCGSSGDIGFATGTLPNSGCSAVITSDCHCYVYLMLGGACSRYGLVSFCSQDGSYNPSSECMFNLNGECFQAAKCPDVGRGWIETRCSCFYLVTTFEMRSDGTAVIDGLGMSAHSVYGGCGCTVNCFCRCSASVCFLNCPAMPTTAHAARYGARRVPGRMCSSHYTVGCPSNGVQWVRSPYICNCCYCPLSFGFNTIWAFPQGNIGWICNNCASGLVSLGYRTNTCVGCRVYSKFCSICNISGLPNPSTATCFGGNHLYSHGSCAYLAQVGYANNCCGIFLTKMCFGSSGICVQWSKRITAPTAGNGNGASCNPWGIGRIGFFTNCTHEKMYITGINCCCDPGTTCTKISPFAMALDYLNEPPNGCYAGLCISDNGISFTTTSNCLGAVCCCCKYAVGGSISNISLNGFAGSSCIFSKADHNVDCIGDCRTTVKIK